VVGFEDGVPRFAFHTGTGRGGPAALADVAGPGPYDVDLREVSGDALMTGDRKRFGVPPGMVADRLAGDPALADRTRAAAPDDGGDAEDRERTEGKSLDAVEAFLEDEEKIDAIRDRAREEAKERAERWGLETELGE
jgi:hypothetical protein